VDASALPGYLEAIRVRVAAAAVPVAGAMGKTYEKHLVNVTMEESGTHPPVTFTPAAPGRPPAIMTGRLRDSVAMAGPAGGGGIGYSSVAPHTIYAATQEWGAIHTAKSGPFMWLWIHYIGMRGVLARGWLRHEVTIPERPYMRTATEEEIANGELHDAAVVAFDATVWGR